MFLHRAANRAKHVIDCDLAYVDDPWARGVKARPCAALESPLHSANNDAEVNLFATAESLPQAIDDMDGLPNKPNKDNVHTKSDGHFLHVILAKLI